MRSSPYVLRHEAIEHSKKNSGLKWEIEILDDQNPKERQKQHNKIKNLEEPQSKIKKKLNYKWFDL